MLLVIDNYDSFTYNLYQMVQALTETVVEVVRNDAIDFENLLEKNEIEVLGARVHNLKNIDVTIPREKLVVITGLSGSGKSSLAFDTIYAEGQRRYIETFSAYARQFLGSLERPDVDKIDGLSPVIAIEQKTTSESPRSTVGTITEIYDFLRLLFARAADAYSYETGDKMVSYNDEQIKDLILESYKGKRINILSPVIRSRKGHYRELFEQIAKQGFVKVRIDGEIRDLEYGMKVDRYKTHDIEIVIDRINIIDKEIERLKAANCGTPIETPNGRQASRHRSSCPPQFRRACRPPARWARVSGPAREPRRAPASSPSACPAQPPTSPADGRRRYCR